MFFKTLLTDFTLEIIQILKKIVLLKVCVFILITKLQWTLIGFRFKALAFVFLKMASVSFLVLHLPVCQEDKWELWVNLYRNMVLIKRLYQSSDSWQSVSHRPKANASTYWEQTCSMTYTTTICIFTNKFVVLAKQKLKKLMTFSFLKSPKCKMFSYFQLTLEANGLLKKLNNS